MKRKIAAFVVAATTTFAMINLAAGPAVAYDQSEPGTNLLTFPTGLTLSVGGSGAGGNTFTTGTYTSYTLQNVTTYDPLFPTATGVKWQLSGTPVFNSEVSGGTMTFTFSQPVLNPRMHTTGTGGTVWNQTSGAILQSFGWSLTNLTGTWTPLAGFTGYTTDSTHVTFPDGPMKVQDASNLCTPLDPGDVASQCGSLQLDGVVTTASVQVTYYGTIVSSYTASNALGQSNLTFTVDESLAGTATTDTALPASYQSAGSVVTDLRLGTNIEIWGPSTKGGTTPAAQAQKGNVDGVASVPTVIPGHPVTVNASIQGASKPAFAYAWIDLNDNGTFDSGESVAGTISGSNATFTFPATMTQGAVVGESFMRVRTGYTQGQVSSPSGWSDSGEVEDYSIEIQAASNPAITSPANGSSINTPTPTLSGTGDPGDTIAVTNVGGATLCTATVQNDGTWSCDSAVPLTEGTNTLTPTATDPVGGTLPGTPITVTLDTVPPTAPAFTGPAPGDTNDNTPTFTGTGDAGDTITVTDENDTPVCTTTVGTEGTWSCTPSTPIADGDHTFTPTAKDTAGNTTPGAPLNLAVDTVPPTAPAFTGPAPGDTNDNTPTFTGTGDAGDTITVTDENDNPVCTTTVGTEGTWSCTPSTPIADGDHTFTPTAKDTAGNTTPGAPLNLAVDTVPPTAPAFTGPAPGLTNDNTPTFTGTGDAGDTITVTDENDTPVCSTTVGTEGTWSCTPTTPIADGDHTFTPTAKDTAGNTTPGTPLNLTIDTVPPTAPAFTGPAPGDTNDNTPTFTGTGDAGTTITITDENDTPVCTTTVNTDGTWSCTPAAIPDGDHTFTPTAKDTAGNTTPGTPLDLTIDTVAPTAPVFTGPTPGDTNDNTPTFTGTGEAGTTITVTDENDTPVCSTTVAADGTWSCTPATPIADGDHTFTPTAKDLAGNTTPGTPLSLTIDTVAPTAPVFTGPTPGDTNDNTPTFTGTGEAGSTITVTDENDTPVCSTTVGSDGTWSCTPSTPIADGDHTFTPTAKDAAGNTTPGTPLALAIDTVPPTAPAFTGPAPGLTNDNTPTFTGTGEAGDTITVTDENDTAVCTTTVETNGTWSCTPTTSIADGDHTFTPTAKDPAGNTAPGAPLDLTIDTVPPTTPVFTGPAPGATNDNTPTFTGTGEAGSTITVTDENDTPVCTTTVGTDGTWTCTAPTLYPDGDHTFTPTAKDTAGNTASGSPLDLTIDTVPPTAPAFTGPAAGLTNDNTPAFTGTGEAGDTITVTDENDSPVCTTTVNTDGTWSCTPTTPIPDGDHTFTPTAKDPAGNTTPGTSLTLAVDTVPPTAPALTGPAPGATNDNTPTFTGTGEAGDTITVTDENDTPVCSTTVGTDGTWSCTPTTPIPDGNHTFTPTAKDLAGNTTPGTSLALAVDTVPPTAPVVTGPTPGPINDTTPTFTGTGEAGTTVTLTDDGGNPVCSTTVAANGTWSCTATTPFTDGDHTITPTATDAAGNTTPGTPVGLTIDTVPPIAPSFTGPAPGTTDTGRPTFTGTGEAGDTIAITDENGNPVCTTTVGADGTWRCTPATPIPDGDHTFTPTAKDPAGNTTPGTPLSLTIDAVPPAVPAITSPASGTSSGTAQPTFAGTGEPGATVRVVNSAGNLVCSATVGADGTWACTPPSPLPLGTATYTPIATNPDGSQTTGTPISYTVVGESKTLVVNHPSASGTASLQPTFDGMGQPGAAIAVRDAAGNLLCSTTVGADGTWSCTPSSPLKAGVLQYTVTQTDSLGRVQTWGPATLTLTGATGSSSGSIAATGSESGSVLYLTMLALALGLTLCAAARRRRASEVRRG